MGLAHFEWVTPFFAGVSMLREPIPIHNDINLIP